DLRDAQQARVGIGLRQLRNQLLVAVVGQLPAPVEGALVTETDLPARGLFHKTRIFADEDLEQGLVALTTERIPGTRGEMRAGHAQARDMLELARGQALPGVGAKLELPDRLR